MANSTTVRRQVAIPEVRQEELKIKNMVVTVAGENTVIINVGRPNTVIRAMANTIGHLIHRLLARGEPREEILSLMRGVGDHGRKPDGTAPGHSIAGIVDAMAIGLQEGWDSLEE